MPPVLSAILFMLAFFLPLLAVLAFIFSCVYYFVLASATYKFISNKYPAKIRNYAYIWILKSQWVQIFTFPMNADENRDFANEKLSWIPPMPHTKEFGTHIWVMRITYIVIFLSIAGFILLGAPT